MTASAGDVAGAEAVAEARGAQGVTEGAGTQAGAGAPTVDIAVDNDILIKSLRYGITEALVPASTYPERGVLEVAKHVVPTVVRRKHRRSDSEVDADITALFASWTLLNPTEDEVGLAAEIESAAQALGIPVDSGESQLVAITVLGRATEVATGDKRAIEGLDRLLDEVGGLQRVSGRVRCLEHLVRDLVLSGDDPPPLSHSVCRDPDADRALYYCCTCTSPTPAAKAAVIECLDSNIDHLAARAPRILEV